jgi:large subunit ribosomal protein L3
MLRALSGAPGSPAAPRPRGDRNVAIEFLCRKLGMTRLFEDDGRSYGVTVLDASPNVVVQRKTEATDGYTAVQLGAGERRANLFSKAMRGHFEKAKVAPKRHVAESRIDAADAEKLEPGSELKVDLFSRGQRVDVIGTSKGRGTAGVVKRHNFDVSVEGHGTHEFFRHGGSIGANTYPGRIIKGLRMSGRMGNERVTTRNVEVVKVDAERNLLYLRGSVPGHPNALVRVRTAVAPK